MRFDTYDTFLSGLLMVIVVIAAVVTGWVFALLCACVCSALFGFSAALTWIEKK